MAKGLKIGRSAIPYARNALSFYRSHNAVGTKRDLRITQLQMAVHIGATQSAVSRALKSNAGKLETLIGLAEACDVPAPVFLRKVADLAAGEETRALPLNELDDMRIDRDSLKEDLSNARALLRLYEDELTELRARAQRGNP